ncbi:MAG: metallophosphoesterase family protein [Anaerolineae bacterium]|nr:metallophosphoesterase family protein [Anaerolineae bacterium]MCZ7551519.1 metallophosphatase family protein [Anaerolineales bacterium]
MSQEPQSPPASPFTLGVIADTHVPDRRKALDPRILPLFEFCGVRAILHAGDVSAPAVLEDLRRVAPVFAVRGNRDWLWLGSLPPTRHLSFNGVSIGLTHGHGGWLRYLLDWPVYKLFGVNLERLALRQQAQFPPSNVIVFGHAHLIMNRRINGQLYFNPGSPHFPQPKKPVPSLGLLHIENGGKVRGEIIDLEGCPIHSNASMK